MNWDEGKGRKFSQTGIEKSNINLEDKNKYQEYFSWFLDVSEKFHKVFGKYF